MEVEVLRLEVLYIFRRYKFLILVVGFGVFVF